MQDHNLFSRFHVARPGSADRELLTTPQGRTLTYGDADRCSARIANHLTALGVRPGERVSVQVEKSADNLCLYLACLRAGFVYHPLNMGYKQAELDYLIGNAEPAAVICDSTRESTLGAIAQSARARHVLTLDQDGTGTLMEGARDRDSHCPVHPCAPDDMAALLYSSGTTGRPKGIILSHDNLFSNTQALVDLWGFTPEDRLLHGLPIFHVHGLFVALGCVLAVGASMRWLDGFTTDHAIGHLPGCTVMMGVPTYYTRLLGDERFTADVCRSMRLFISGSAPLLTETFLQFEARTGHRILERYGMSETGMNTSNPLMGERKPGTVGPPLPGVDLRITGEDGAVLDQGEIGGIEVRGRNVFKGYWKMPEKTAEDFTADGFFRTGDMGRIDEDGYVAIVGRAKDLVITGGLNVYPKELELFIDALEGVKESAVIGVPHDDFGEAIIAVVVADGPISAQAIIDACRRDLAAFKVPKKVIFVPDLPRNTMAKVQKNLLRETYADTFGT